MSLRLVTDCSAIINALIGSDARMSVLDGTQLQAPCVIDFEIVSALRRLVRTSSLTPNAAREVLDQWVTLDVVRHPAEPLLARMWELRHNFSAYDAAYVALAEALGAPLLTVDQRLANSASAYCEVIA